MNTACGFLVDNGFLRCSQSPIKNSQPLGSSSTNNNKTKILVLLVN